MKLENESASIKTDVTYVIWINRKRHEGFRVVSTWNGLTELKNTEGKVIACIPPDPFLDTLLAMEDEEKEIKIISASECFFE